MDQNKHLAFAILEHLQACIDNKTIKEDDAESMQVAMQCIGESFHVDIANASDQSKYSMKPATLMSVFEVFLKAQNKPAASGKSDLSEATKKEAEDFKAKGNAKLLEKNFDEAISCYTEAIALNPREPVYFSNRAAAYSQVGKHDKAVQDCNMAISIDAKYAKAYSRLGLAQYSLENYAEAVTAYKKALEFDPSNASVKQSLQTAESKLQQKSAPANRDASAADAMGGLGGLGNMDLGSLMNNPALMNMAAKFMQNPQMAKMMQSMGAGGSGAPGIGDMLNNPEMMNMFSDMAQNPEIQAAMQDPSVQESLKKIKK